jgi:hypothetical protein
VDAFKALVNILLGFTRLEGLNMSSMGLSQEMIDEFAVLLEAKKNSFGYLR